MIKPRSWTWFGLFWAAAWIAVAVWLVHEMRWWSTTLQLVGAVVTAYGLARAYVRSSKHDETVGQYIKRKAAECWAKLSGRHIRVPLPPISRAMAATMGRPVTRLRADRVTLNESQSLQLQIATIAYHLNRLIEGQLPTMEDRIDEVKRDVARMTSDLSTLDQQTRDQIERRLDEFDKRLNTKQVLDLGWAIFGLAITTVGIALGY